MPETVTDRAAAGRGDLPEVPLVGRDPEVAALEGALSGARDGSGGIVLVRGEAGVGKTRLVKEVVGRTEDALLLKGFCRPGVLGRPICRSRRRCGPVGRPARLRSAMATRPPTTCCFPSWVRLPT